MHYNVYIVTIIADYRLILGINIFFLETISDWLANLI